jgi:hypothetical protein
MEVIIFMDLHNTSEKGNLTWCARDVRRGWMGSTLHALEPFNAVTIAHSGVPPAMGELANHFEGRACDGSLNLYFGYDYRDIVEGSRDFTTFQTPFGALRLVKLPQGWTNSVPIFHDDVTYIPEDEIPHVTIPYINDVPIWGPSSRYQDKDGTFETIPENKGIQ